MRALVAAALAAISLILVVLCARGILPGLGVVAPMTLAFVGACVGILGATEQETSVARRRFAVGATVAATLVLIVACALLLRALGGT